MNAPETCPKCGAPAWYIDDKSAHYDCGSWIDHGNPTILHTTIDTFDPCRIRSLENERDALLARVMELMEAGSGLAGVWPPTKEQWEAWRKVMEDKP